MVSKFLTETLLLEHKGEKASHHEENFPFQNSILSQTINKYEYIINIFQTNFSKIPVSLLQEITKSVHHQNESINKESIQYETHVKGNLIQERDKETLRVIPLVRHAHPTSDLFQPPELQASHSTVSLDWSRRVDAPRRKLLRKIQKYKNQYTLKILRGSIMSEYLGINK